ncbi:MAG TPA: hypothetical protein VHD62_13830 [Opitutaceae bacterium]|nr:hypothetical protein [Opitutaceae bacterium]
MNALLTTAVHDWTPLAIATKLLWLAQLALLVHVLKTGRPYWWFWILISAPVIGGLAYAVIELAPALRGSGGTLNWKPRAWRIRDLRTTLEETDTVKLKLTLARELLAAKQPDEACKVAEDCLTGVWRDDPHTLAAVARYRLEVGQSAAALGALDKVDVSHDRMLAAEVALLRGRALVEAGRHAEAQESLRRIAATYIGEEPRYFLAVSLHATGATAAAREIWSDIRQRFRRANSGWRRAERRWFKLAGERLAETGNA